MPGRGFCERGGAGNARQEYSGVSGRTAAEGAQIHMRLFLLLVAAMLGSALALAQSGQASPDGSTPQDTPARDLPVSLERIRELLAQAPHESMLNSLDRQPDFKVTVEERRFLKDILENLEIPASPAPPGGLYGYETQRQMANTRNSPLARPYAAFTSGELAQVSLTSILSALVTRYLTSGARNISRTQAEELARADVQRAINNYCVARPDRSQIEICRLPPPP